MTNPHLRERRSFLMLALAAPLAVVGCGNSGDDTHIEIGDATKAEVQARAEGYRARAAEKRKKKGGPRR